MATEVGPFVVVVVDTVTGEVGLETSKIERVLAL